MGPSFFTNARNFQKKNSAYTKIKDDGNQDAYKADTVAGPRYQPELTRGSDAKNPFASPDDPPIPETNHRHPRLDLKSVNDETRPDMQRNRDQATSTGPSVSSAHGHVQSTTATASNVSTSRNNMARFMVEGSDHRFLYTDGSEGSLRDHWNPEALMEKLVRNGGLQSPEAAWRERMQAKKDARARAERRGNEGGGFGVPWGESDPDRNE
ncbi:hypothetical protein EYR40_002215 [Pleurotus pulmonarius]|nr:hypothetical protein EYR36_002292 [Pleurotus pulmonarius]KAF4583724.1 hypothetical protein EYR40_002215 [Pleurotus pulmonarius]KAF4587990.1 hypothetical protein EYR38_009951 [Pleurotus pulmonarius]